MTYDRAIEGTGRGSQRARGRKSWPHVLTPTGRGRSAGPMMSARAPHAALLPLGRRCPVEPKARLRRDGADEGAFSAAGAQRTPCNATRTTPGTINAIV